MNEKDNLILQFRKNQKILKEKLKKNNTNPELIPFYEQQLNEKDQTISVEII